MSPASQRPPPRQILLAAALVALLSSLTLYVRLGAPAHPIWDESYYLTSTQRYLEGRAQFASHPPLGLMLIAAGDALSGPRRDTDRHLAQDKSVAGEAVPADYPYIRLRVASALFGVVGAALFFLLMLELTSALTPSLLLANLYVFENAFLVQFRAGHLDAFQTVFVLAALLLTARAAMRDRLSTGEAFALGLACGLAAMVRLNGVFLLPLAGLLATLPLWRAPKAWRKAARDGAPIGGGALLAVAAVMTVHVAVSSRSPDAATAAGRHDAAFVSPTYADYLAGRRPLGPAIVLAAANDYRRYIVADYDGMARADANGSDPLTWPLHRGTINYRWDSDGTATRYLQLAGNRVGWAISLAGLVAGAALSLGGGWSDPRRRTTACLLLAAFAEFWAMHIILGRHRLMYLYHYFPGLLLGFALFALAWTEARQRWPRQDTALAALLAIHLACFMWQAPLTYHRPLIPGACARLNWGQTIVACRPDNNRHEP